MPHCQLQEPSGVVDSTKMVDAANDSGATTTVVGKSWLRNSGVEREFANRKDIRRMYRFGDSRTFGSMGIVELRVFGQAYRGEGKVHREAIFAVADVVNCVVPLLISRTSISLIHASLDFHQRELCLANGMVIPLSLAPNGHLTLTLPREVEGRCQNKVE